MDETVRELRNDRRVQWGVIAVIFLLAAFLAVKTIAELKEFRYIGGGVPVTNTVTVMGEGEVFAIPDVATFTIGVLEQADTATEAQEAVAEKMNAVTDYLKGQNVDERDIKTINYNVYPRYDYVQESCTAVRCTPGRQELAGFEANYNLEVKVRDTKQAGVLLSGVSEAGANTVSGLTFTVDDEESLQREAREKAITDAREKAEQLADDLNVRLVRVVSFAESNGYPGYPMFYAKEMSANVGMGGIAMDATQSAPELPVGENKILMNVSITYEIR